MEFKINDIYILGDDSYYEGQKVILLAKSKSKILSSGINRYTQGHGMLISNKKRINFVLENLKTNKENKKSFNPYSKFPKLLLIKKIKRGDKKALKEYVMRYKKKPKFL